MRFSVVVPFFNERENLVSLHEELVGVLNTLGGSYELIYVNDGSSDESENVFSQLTNCVVIHLRRSFGQTAALSAGFARATGEILITLDGDMQNDPADIPGMLQYLDNNKLDMVVGWRKKRFDGIDKLIPSYIAYTIRQFLLSDGIHDAGCGLKVFRKCVLEDLSLYGEMHRFFASIVKIRGYRVGEYVVNHRSRTKGRSKYTWKRGVKGFLDMLAVAFWGKFSARPLHILGSIGLLVIVLSLCIEFVAVFHTFPEYNVLITQNWIMVGALMFILGVQLVIFGLIADIAVRGYFAASGRKGYFIREVEEH
jgi:glycosyltransferase involved in cell wall biosynthesis